MITAGVDVGSVATKAVVLAHGSVVGRASIDTGADARAASGAALAQALDQAKLSRADVKRIVSTGYGRRAAQLDGRVITEITAAGRGAFAAGAPWGTVRTVVDLGGQDTKVILLDPRGNVVDFVMNDKCAAGTGRFLSLMAQALEVKLADLGELARCAKEPVSINATCAVFAESEVVSQIGQGRSKEDIIAGLHAAIARRIAAMVQQMGGAEVLFTGGGARNTGVRAALEQSLGHPVHVPPHPQYIVATGAAIIAAE